MSTVVGSVQSLAGHLQYLLSLYAALNSPGKSNISIESPSSREHKLTAFCRMQSFIQMDNRRNKSLRLSFADRAALSSLFAHP